MMRYTSLKENVSFVPYHMVKTLKQQSENKYTVQKETLVSKMTHYRRLHLPVNALAHKTCFQMTSNVCVSGVKL